MLQRISCCYRYAQKSLKIAGIALFSFTLPEVANAQTDLVVDDFQSGYPGQAVHGADTYYSSPVPRWYYSSSHALDASGAYIAADASSANQYMYFNGQVNTWSITWVDCDSASYLTLNPAKRYRIEFDLLNVTGAGETSALLLHYLLNDRWTNMGAVVQTDPAGYRLQLHISGDNTVGYKIIHKGGGQFIDVPGAAGEAEVAPACSARAKPNRAVPCESLSSSFRTSRACTSTAWSSSPSISIPCRRICFLATDSGCRSGPAPDKLAGWTTFYSRNWRLRSLNPGLLLNRVRFTG